MDLSFSELGISSKDIVQTKRQCAVHHVPLFKLGDMTPVCPICQKLRIEAKNQALVKQETERWQRRKTVDRLKRDSILTDSDLMRADFSNFKAPSEEARNNFKLARHIAGEYLDPKIAFNTLLTGPPGRGKSHLALSILKAVNEHSKAPTSCLFISMNELYRRIKASFSYPDSKYTEQSMAEQIGNAGLVVLDDLGSEGAFQRNAKEASEFVQGFLFGIFNQRRRTIITTNLTSRQMSAIYNEKLLSRMFKGVDGHIIRFTKDGTPDNRRRVEF